MYLRVIISELRVVLWGLGLQILQISHFVFSEIKVTSHRAVGCRPCQKIWQQAANKNKSGQQ
jgi:hypothetical protein